ncbi:putative tetratricopeptide-like helical domain superfamily [Helianthus annuus]|nr:putative tetratricopeptide-like helical domain superfamily [Helianthus annuus]
MPKHSLTFQRSLMKLSRLCTSNYFGYLSYAKRLVNRHSENSKLSSLTNVTTLTYSTIKGNNVDSDKETILNFKRIHCSGIRSFELTYASVFKACASLLALEEGRQIQVDCLKHGLDSDVYVGNTMIHFYGCCKKIIDAHKVFDEMPYTSVVSWNTIISAYFRVSWFYESVECFMKMRNVGIEPDGTTFVVVLSVCAELGNLTFGKYVHAQMIEKGLGLTCRLGTALINMYGKCGALNMASLVFDKMVDCNVWTWSAMIQGLAQHGLARHAIALFEKMKDASIQPNHVTFLGVICACSHAGYVEDGYRFFEEMKNVYGIKPRLTHYGAMVDVLGRAGHLTEAYNFIVNMPIEPDPTVWRTLLSACSVHSASDFDGVGEKVQKKLLELEPRWSGNLVMVANKYAEVCKWEDAAQMRKSMRFKRLKKIAGESCIEVNGLTFRLLSGFDSQAPCVDIYLLLDGLCLNMKINNP